MPHVAGYSHGAWFEDLAQTVHHGLLGLGCDSRITSAFDGTGSQYIVFGAHLLGVEQTIPRDAIIYNWEAVGAASMPPLALLHPHRVWDFSATNVSFWTRYGIDARRVPIGYADAMCRVRSQRPDIDVLFYGAMSDRRERILSRLEARGARIHACSGVFGLERDELLGRSKIVLNVHCYEKLPIFECARVFYPLSNQICVVSEDGDGAGDFGEGVLLAPYDELVDACMRHVEDETLRQRQAARGFATMMMRPESEILRRALET